MLFYGAICEWGPICHNWQLFYICKTRKELKQAGAMREWGFCREADKNSALLAYYAARSGDFLPTMRDNLSVPYSWFHNPEECSSQAGTSFVEL